MLRVGILLLKAAFVVDDLNRALYLPLFFYILLLPTSLGPHEDMSVFSRWPVNTISCLLFEGETQCDYTLERCA